MTAQEKLITYAKSQVGTTEYDGGKNIYSKFIDETYPPKKWYNGRKNGFDWCTCFVDACFLKTFTYDESKAMLNADDPQYGLLRAGVKYMYYCYNKKGWFSKTPSEGAVIFFGSLPSLRHVGIVTSYTAKYVYTIEGNSGNAVREHKYLRTDPDIFGYGIPNWSVVEKDYFIKDEFYRISCKDNLNIRTDGNITSAAVGQLKPKTIVQCLGQVVQDKYIWVKIAAGLYICGRENGTDYLKGV